MAEKLDGNKTALTHRVTAVAAAYLASFGCKPVETEVPVGYGWVADVASFWYPTKTEAEKVHLPRIIAERLGIPKAKALYVTGDGPLTALVEVKTTKADFQRDSKWQRPAPAHLCFVAFPHKLIEPAIPKNWGGLETSQDGTRLIKVHRPRRFSINPQHPGIVLDFVAQVAIRRHHRTEYQADRDWLRSYRAKDQETKKRYNAVHLLDSLAAWLQGKGWHSGQPLRELLPELGIKKLPKCGEPAVAYFQVLRDQATRSAP